MLTRSPRVWAVAFLAVPLAYLACGGNVVVDHGDDGSGGEPPTSSNGTTTPGTTTNVTSTNVTSNNVTTNNVTSTGTGPSDCDNHPEGCCDISCGCIGCAIEGPCSDALAKCQETEACIDFVNCSESCVDQSCYDECIMQFPEGANLYNELVFCVICDQCPNDCDGPGSGC